MYSAAILRYPSGQRRRRRSRFVRIGWKSCGVNRLGVCCGLVLGNGFSAWWRTSRGDRRSRFAAAAVAAVRCGPCIACGASRPSVRRRVCGLPCVACRSRRWCTVPPVGCKPDRRRRLTLGAATPHAPGRDSFGRPSVPYSVGSHPAGRFGVYGAGRVSPPAAGAPRDRLPGRGRPMAAIISRGKPP